MLGPGPRSGQALVVRQYQPFRSAASGSGCWWASRFGPPPCRSPGPPRKTQRIRMQPPAPRHLPTRFSSRRAPGDFLLPSLCCYLQHGPDFDRSTCSSSRPLKRWSCMPLLPTVLLAPVRLFLKPVPALTQASIRVRSATAFFEVFTCASVGFNSFVQNIAPGYWLPAALRVVFGRTPTFHLTRSGLVANGERKVL